VLLGRGREEALEGVLDGLGERGCNIHLVMFLLDAVVLRVFPELGVGGDRVQSQNPEEISRSVSGATYTSFTPSSEAVVS